MTNFLQFSSLPGRVQVSLKVRRAIKAHRRKTSDPKNRMSGLGGNRTFQLGRVGNLAKEPPLRRREHFKGGSFTLGHVKQIGRLIIPLEILCFSFPEFSFPREKSLEASSHDDFLGLPTLLSLTQKSRLFLFFV